MFSALNESDTDRVVRARQVLAAEQNSEKALAGTILTAPLTTVLFFETWGGTLLVWDVAVALVCISRLLVARGAIRHPPATLDRSALLKYSAWSILTSATIVSAPMWVQLHTDGLTFAYMLALTLGTFWCGCMALSPLFPAAVSFALTPMALLAFFIAIIGYDSERLGLFALFAAGTAIGLDVTHHMSNLFKHSVLQHLELVQKGKDLQRNADVIGLLLKEHEEQSSDWLWQIDRNGRVCRASSRFQEVMGCDAGALEGRPLQQLLIASSPAGAVEGLDALLAQVLARQSFRDHVIFFEGETPRWWCVSGQPMFDSEGAFEGFRGVMADVTAAKLAESRIIYLARHDALTDLPNRAYFSERLVDELKGPADAPLAALSIDLDGFKPVNDRYGHPVGDALLTGLAERLRASVDAADLVARLGGDEFAVLTRSSEPDAVEALCRRLIATLSEPLQIGNVVITVGASIGVAFAPSDGKTAEELLKNADSALYRAKNDGRGTFRFFAAAMDQQLQERVQLVHDLRLALTRNELMLHYQPFVDARTGRITGCEALLRWTHPQRGLVQPDEFIPIAEQSGLIVPMGAWVLREACREAATWSKHLRVSVNISPVQFRDRNLPDFILSTLYETGLPSHRLEVEITETVLVRDADAALEILRRIRGLGVRIALDDFGTGYSSLSYLRRFPFDKVKIDRSFVNGLDTRRDNQIIVRAIQDIARGLDMTVTAEGVETLEQAEQLRLTGCQELQGYFYSRPQPISNLQQLREAPPDGASFAPTASLTGLTEARLSA